MKKLKELEASFDKKLNVVAKKHGWPPRKKQRVENEIQSFVAACGYAKLVFGIVTRGCVVTCHRMRLNKAKQIVEEANKRRQETRPVPQAAPSKKRKETRGCKD
jgi:hypothetical protein